MMRALNAPTAVAEPTAREQMIDFLLAPFEGDTWRAFGAVVLGFFIAIFSFSLLAALFSIGGSMLLFLVGFAIVGLGIELCRIVARAERWRMGLLDG
jgi:hypothetical protein